MKLHLLWHLSIQASPKYHRLKSFFFVHFNSNDALGAAIEAINAKQPTWRDPSDNQEAKIYVKRDKDLEKRKIGQFRSHFYTAFEQYFSNHVDYMHKQFKVEIFNSNFCSMTVDVEDVRIR